MISRNKTRQTLKSTLTSLKKDGVNIQYPMAKFRHAIFETVDKCKSLQFNSWTFDTSEELTICNLFFKSKKISCAYDYKKDSITVSLYELVDDCEILAAMFDCSCEQLAEEVHKYQPKIKIVRKK